MTKDDKSKGTGFYIFFSASVFTFLGALILLWQGLVQVKNFDGEFEDFQQMIHSFMTFQNEGIILIAAAFFLFIVALQFSVYALLLKK